MSNARIESLDGRTLLHGAGTFIPEWTEQARHRSSAEAFVERYGNTNLNASVQFDDLLVLAQNYGGSADTAIWNQGDTDYDGLVTFDDLLALAQNYGSSISLPENVPELPASTPRLPNFNSDGSSDGHYAASVSEGRLVITLGNDANITLRASTTSTGKLRVFYSSQAGVENQLVLAKASKVKSVHILDTNSSHTITLAPGFPAASVFLAGGDDRLNANEKANIIHGGDGNDTIFAGGGDDIVYGEGGRDRLFGEGGTDALDGGTSKDYLDGGKGRNFLIGGKGADKLTVRSGKDKLDRDADDSVIS